MGWLFILKFRFWSSGEFLRSKNSHMRRWTACLKLIGEHTLFRFWSIRNRPIAIHRFKALVMKPISFLVSSLILRYLVQHKARMFFIESLFYPSQIWIVVAVVLVYRKVEFSSIVHGCLLLIQEGVICDWGAFRSSYRWVELNTAIDFFDYLHHIVFMRWDNGFFVFSVGKSRWLDFTFV